MSTRYSIKTALALPDLDSWEFWVDEVVTAPQVPDRIHHKILTGDGHFSQAAALLAAKRAVVLHVTRAASETSQSYSIEDLLADVGAVRVEVDERGNKTFVWEHP